MPNFKDKMVYKQPNADGATMAANIYVFGDIGEWYNYNAKTVENALSTDEEITNIDVYISSDGGSLKEVFKMHDMLKGHPATVTAHLVGVVASAATILACAADKVIMSRQCLYMVHRAEWFAEGNADQIRKSLNTLEKFEGIAIKAYGRKTGLDEDDIMSLMKEESWLEPEAALALGFVDELTDAISFEFDAPNDYKCNDVWSDWYGWMKVDGRNANDLYSKAGITMLAKGYKPHHITNKSKMSKSTTNIWNKIVNLLPFIPDGKKEEAVKMLSENEELKTAMQDEQITMAVTAQLEKQKPSTPIEPIKMTLQDLLTEIEGASEDELESLRSKLGISAIDNQSSDNGESDAMAALNAKVDTIINSMAGKMNQKPQRPTNGTSDITNKGGGKEGDGKQKLNAAHIAMLNTAYYEGNITKENYKAMTGKEPPQKVAV